jgi:hypothetical protein
MGVNGQKRKKKQKAVPSLEETLPKKFKSGNGTKKETAENYSKTKGAPKLATSLNGHGSTSIPVEQQNNGLNENVDVDVGFQVTKASLFDDEDEEVDEFDMLNDDADMYAL